MLLRTDALVLRTYPFGEAHRIVVLLTRDLGRQRATAFGAGSSRSRFGSGLELMAYLHVVLRRREGQELATLQNCEIIQPSPAFRLGLEANVYLGYFAELMLEFTREEAGAEREFRLTLAVLEALQRGVEPKLLARYVELWLLRLEGLLPDPHGVLPRETAEWCKALMKLPPQELGNHRWEGSELNLVEGWTMRLIEGHLEKPIRARRLLKELG